MRKCSNSNSTWESALIQTVREKVPSSQTVREKVLLSQIVCEKVPFEMQRVESQPSQEDANCAHVGKSRWNTRGPRTLKTIFLWPMHIDAPRTPQLVVTSSDLKIEIHNITCKIPRTSAVRQCSGFWFWTLHFRLRKLSLRIWKLYFLVRRKSAQRPHF